MWKKSWEVFQVQLTDPGQCSAVTKDSLKVLVFLKRKSNRSESSLYFLQNKWNSCAMPSPVSRATAKTKTGGNCKGSRRGPRKLHCTVSFLPPKSCHVNKLLSSCYLRSSLQSRHSQVPPLSHTSKMREMVQAAWTPGSGLVSFAAAFHSFYLSPRVQMTELQVTDIKQHNSCSRPQHAETLQELRHVPSHEHLLLLPPNTSRSVHSSCPHGRY